MMDQVLARCCSPTLAGIKTASMFNAEFISKEEMQESLRALNLRLAPKGIRIVPLRHGRGKTLLYMFRPSRLAKDIACPKAREILASAGYTSSNCTGCLCELIRKMQKKGGTFPHEVGLFLGYPPEDVLGFIRHKGGDMLTAGYWKVYSDKEKAENTFCRFRTCTRFYCDGVRMGKTIEELAGAES